MPVKIEELKRFLRDYFFSKSPGVFLLLDHISRERLGVNLVDAVFQFPDRLYQLILETYKDTITANFIYKNFLLKPITLKIEAKISLDDLYNAAKGGSERFIEILKKGGIDFCVQKEMTQ